eukprot:201599_1
MDNRRKETVLLLLDSLVNGRDIHLTQQKLSEHSSLSGYGMVLLSIFCNGCANSLVRQQSGILLKNFLSQNWENDRIDEKEKNAIKAQILNEELFGDKNANIRKTTAMIISVLAEFDFPEKWNNLLSVILSFIDKACNEKNILLLSGSIQCLAYFVENICDLQIPTIAPLLFPLLLQICSECSIENNIRFNALSVYHTLLCITLEMRIINPNLTKQLINPTILKYLQWINDDVLKSQNIQNIKLQSLSLNILNDITKSYSLSIVNCLPTVLSSVWKLMIFYSDHRDRNSADLDIYEFYDNAFIWIHSILRHKRREIGHLLDDKLNDICVLYIKLLTISDNDNDLHSFMHSPNEFIFNEENVCFQNNLRGLIRNVVRNTLEIRPRTGYYSLLQSAKRSLSASGSTPSVFHRESVLLIFGILAEFKHKQKNKSRSRCFKKDFKMEHFLQSVLWNDLHQNNDLLQFRALWTLNKFIFSLNTDAKQQILPQICESMKSTNPLCIRYEAIKCFESIALCDDMPIAPLLNGVVPLLCHLLTKMNDLTLKYLLKCLCSIIKHNAVKCREYESQIIPLIIGLWSKYCLNHDTTHYIKQLISISVTNNPNNLNIIQQIIPTISKILENTPNCDVSVTNCSLEIMYILMRHKQSFLDDQLNHIYYEQFLPQILELVYGTTDCEQMNIGMKILCLLISNGGANCTESINSICKIISKYLAHDIADSSVGVTIGPLINQFIVNLKCDTPTLNNLVFAVINRIDSCSTATLRNQLLFVFPTLIHQHGDVQIIDFLAVHNKLNSILNLWCSNHNDLIYPYYKKSSVMALAKILQSKAYDGKVSALSFDGYPIINIHAPRASRSRQCVLQFTKMPFYVKFFQILIDTFRDLVSCHHCDNSHEDEDENENDNEQYIEELDYKNDQETEEEEEDDDEYNPDAESEEEEEEEEEESEGEGLQREQEEDVKALQKQQKQHLTLLNTNVGSLQNPPTNIIEREFEHCPQAVNDQIFYMDFEKWAKEFSQTVSNQNGNAFQNMISMLNESDKQILRKILG